MNYAGRNVSFRVLNILRVQLLHHAVGNQLIILGCAQAFGYRFKRDHESGEVFVLIQGASFVLGKDSAAVLEVSVAIVGGGKRRRMAAA